VPDQLTALIPMAHAGSTWFMVGLIWFVQVVHYPLMGAVPPHAFSAYATSHQRRTTWVVGPVMLIEVSSALLLVRAPRGEFTGTLLPWIGVALLVLIWASTFAVQVPLHARLASGFDRAVWHRLVATNWLRTIAWTVRGIIALLLLK
jgi:hypothetical protein